MLRLDLVHRAMERQTTPTSSSSTPAATTRWRATWPAPWDALDRNRPRPCPGGERYRHADQLLDAAGNVALDGGRNSPFAGALLKHSPLERRPERDPDRRAQRCDEGNATKAGAVGALGADRAILFSPRQRRPRQPPRQRRFGSAKPPRRGTEPRTATSVAALELFMAAYQNTYYAGLARLRIDSLREEEASRVGLAKREAELRKAEEAKRLAEAKQAEEQKRLEETKRSEELTKAREEARRAQEALPGCRSRTPRGAQGCGRSSQASGGSDVLGQNGQRTPEHRTPVFSPAGYRYKGIGPLAARQSSSALAAIRGRWMATGRRR